MLDGGFATLGRDVILPGTVTALAPSLFGRTVGSGNGLVMRVLIEGCPYVGVTSLTGGAANEPVGWRWSLCRGHERQTQNRK